MDTQLSHDVELGHERKDDGRRINGEGSASDDDDMEDYSSECNSSTCLSDEEESIEHKYPPDHTYGTKPGPDDARLGVGHALALSTIPRPPPPPPPLDNVKLGVGHALALPAIPRPPPPPPLPPSFPVSRSKPVVSLQALCDPKHFGPLKTSDMKIKEIVLRIASAILSLVAFSVMVSAHENRTASGSTFDVKFSDVQAYSYLVAFNVISVVYSGVQLLMLAQPSNTSFFSSPTKLGLCLYICDQILACLLFSASSSAATASEIARHGLRNIWPPACSTWKLLHFCTRAEIAVVMSFFASFFIMLSSLLSGYYLSRLLKE